MPRSKDPSMYPPEFRDALIAAYNADHAIYWPVESLATARTMRQQLYAYIRATRIAEEITFTAPADRLGTKFSQVSIKAVTYNDSPAVELYSKSATPEMQTLRGILAGLDTTNHEAAKHADALDEALENADEPEHDEGLGDLRDMFKTQPGATHE